MNTIYWVDNKDPEMREASVRAQATFRFFWRELSWERRRIVPAFNFFAIKTMFADRLLAERTPEDEVENMWLSEIEFDGRRLTGTLMNQPNRLKSINKGDIRSFPLEQLMDWMYAGERAYGAFTVNLLRSRMTAVERQIHDEAWGLKFGEPSKILLVPREDADEAEHPMSVNMVPSLRKFLGENPGVVNQPDEDGFTFLHRESLAGNANMVEILLENGADEGLTTKNGDRAMDLAKIMRWQRVINLLRHPAR